MMEIFPKGGKEAAQRWRYDHHDGWILTMGRGTRRTVHKSWCGHLIAVVAVGLMAACGGASQGSAPSPAPKAATPAAKATPAPKPAVAPNFADEQQIQNTVREYEQAVINGDGATACSKLTVQQQQAAQQGLPNQNHHYPSCAEAMGNVGSAIASVLTPAQKSAWENPTFTGSEINGTVADIAYNDGTSIHRVTLTKASGSWLISNET